MDVARGIGCLSIAIAVLGQGSLAGTAQEAPVVPSLSTILTRAARFVDLFTERASGMVVEEAYVQDVVRVNRTSSLRASRTHRELKSDLLLVRPVGTEGWLQFRDVFEVDGRRLRDRNDRLAKLFIEPWTSTAAQVEKLMRESSRYNIGDVERTINLPTLGLAILDRKAQGAFEFRLDDTKDEADDVMAVPKTSAFAIPPDAIAVAFRETQIQTMVRDLKGKNLPAMGRFWFVPSSGHVIMTEFRVQDYTFGAVIHVTYRPPPGIDGLMPATMHEMYKSALNKRLVEGTATYSNFRTFNVAVDEQLAPPTPPPQ